MIKEASGAWTAGRRYAEPCDFYLAFGIAVLAVLLHTATLSTELFRAAESRAFTTSTLPRILVLIELCLLVNAAGLWARKRAGLWVSLVALLSAGLGYAGWYAYSRQVLELLSSQPFYQVHNEAIPPHPFGLIGATWLNCVVLLSSGVLFAWVLKTLHGMTRTSSTRDVDAG